MDYLANRKPRTKVRRDKIRRPCWTPIVTRVTNPRLSPGVIQIIPRCSISAAL
jgi:hypothetical protein